MNKIIWHKKGFTLIELLLVISIIALLASIILAALQVAKTKANDSRVVSQLWEMRTASEMTFSSGNYGLAGSMYDCGTNLTNVFNSKFPTSKWPTIDGVVATSTCFSNAINAGDAVTAYSIWHSTSNSNGWCIDSTGASVARSSAPASSSCGTSGSSGSGTMYSVTVNITIPNGSTYNSILLYKNVNFGPTFISGTTFPGGSTVQIAAYVNDGSTAIWTGCDSVVDPGGQGGVRYCIINNISSNKTVNVTGPAPAI